MCIPNLFFNGYWPLWDDNPVIDFSDRFLNELLARGLSRAETLQLYLHSDLSRFYDLDALVQASLDRERAKARCWDIPLLDHVQRCWRKRRLFLTVNHPCRELCVLAAQGALKLLDYEPLGPKALERFAEPFGEFELPIHPQIIARENLEWLTPHTRFNIFGAPRTFNQYVNCYLECRTRGERDFLGFLQTSC